MLPANAIVEVPPPMEEWVEALMPRVLPNEWRQIEGGVVSAETGRHNGNMYVNERRGLRIVMSAAWELDGRRWLHLSMSHPNRLPTWSELVQAKEAFMGKDSRAVQILPPRSEWVNIHAYTLHMFVCLDGDPLPDFTRGGGGL